MKNTIANIIGLSPTVLTTGTYGVEIEVEGTNLPNNLGSLWRVDKDDSLKAGYENWEYVMPKPSDLGGVKTALDHLGSYYKAYKSKVMETITSGVHVHVNVQDYTVREMFTFITGYFALEELLMTYCGPHREGNHFCLRAKDAEWIVYELIYSVKNRNFNNLQNDNIRYCSLNVCSLFKYGSLEFRGMRGTGNLELIYEWTEILDQIKKSCLEFKSPAELMNFLHASNEDTFINRLLGPKRKHFTNISNANRIVREGVRIIQPLAYCVDWSTFKETNNNPFVKGV